jgi:hypothetical protein
MGESASEAEIPIKVFVWEEGEVRTVKSVSVMHGAFGIEVCVTLKQGGVGPHKRVEKLAHPASGALGLHCLDCDEGWALAPGETDGTKCWYPEICDGEQK